MRKRVKITKEVLEPLVRDSSSYNQILTKLGKRLAGGNHSHLKKTVERFELDTSHFLGQKSNIGKTFDSTRRSSDDILILREDGSRCKSHLLKRALLEKGVPHECNKCGQAPEWEGNPLTLDVDHINENWLDDRKENLRFLCPNCHSQFSRKLIKHM